MAKELTVIQQKVLDAITKKSGMNLEGIISATGLKQIVITNSTNALLKLKKIIRLKTNDDSTFSIGLEKKLKASTKKLNPQKKEKEKTKSNKKEVKKEALMKRDKTIYIFNGEMYGKGRLVLAVIKALVKPKTTLAKLEELFPRKILQPGYGVVRKLNEAKKHKKKFFLKKEELVTTGSGTGTIVAAVTNNWGKGNIKLFIDFASKIGFKITSKSK